MTATPPRPRLGGDPAPPSSGKRSRWWVGVLLFVGGLVMGILTVGLLSASTPEFGSAAAGPDGSPSASASTPSVSPGTVPIAAEARVNAACLRVINEAYDVYAVLTGLDEAVTDVDLKQLDDMVRRLQPIQPRLERDLQECQVDTSFSGYPTTPGPGTPGSPAPTPGSLTPAFPAPTMGSLTPTTPEPTLGPTG